MNRELKVAYIAGVIDSDGWIIIAKTQSSFRITLGCHQATTEAVSLASELFGGNVAVKQPSKGRFSKNISYLWLISSKTAYVALKELEPYLRIKKGQAKLAIAYQERLNAYFLLHGTGGSIGILQEEYDARTTYFFAMKKLNNHCTAAETKRKGHHENDVSDSPICMNDKHAETVRNNCPPEYKIQVIK